MKYIRERGSIISVGRLMWDKDLVSGFNGNISLRVNDKHILMTASGTCLGRLSARDIVLVTIDGRVVEGGKPTSERLLHLDIYRSFPAVKAVVHTHAPCINAFFLNNKVFRPKTFEAEYVLGKVYGVSQTGVNVTDTAPVISKLKANPIVALSRHGVVAVGDTLFEGFARIQVLEEQLWVEALSKLYNS
jgi:L-fuculose-phosphate aldolase